MEFLPCDKRQKMVFVDKTGKQQRANVCGEPEAEAFQEKLTPEICEACPLREALMMQKIRVRGYRPPGFADKNTIHQKRADTVPDPGWDPCIYRVNVTYAACCGQTGKTKLCECPSAEYFGNEVAPEICRKCVARK